MEAMIMNNSIHIKLLSENALIFLKKNISIITKKIQEKDDNDWIYTFFPQPMFVEKKLVIHDFELMDNPESSNKEIDFNNSIAIYENLKNLPRYIVCDERFWLWLHFEKFYRVVKGMMPIGVESTIKDHWMHSQGTRRGLMFGVLSRCYFRVALTVDENNPENKYDLTKWVIENPYRFRNLSWRSFSSEPHLVRGILSGEKRAVEQFGGKEDNGLYPEIAKYVSIIGSVRLLDKIKEKDIEEMIYRKMVQLLGGE